MYHPRVSGTYHEMGNHYGTTLYKHGFRLPEQSREKQEFGRRSEKEVKRVFPEILDELHGFATAVHSSYDGAASFLLGIGAFKLEGACSEFASFNGSEMVFGRNYDFYYKFRKYTEAYATRPTDAYSSLGHSDIFIGREDGVNDKGLAVAISFVAPTKVAPGVNFALAARCVLDKCSNVGEAVKKLSTASFSTTNNYLLADKEGEIAVVEASPEKIRVRHPEPGHQYMVATNHFVHAEMVEVENRTKRDPDSAMRYDTIAKALELGKGKIDARTAQKVLSSHEGAVCSHHEGIQLGTLWSLTATLKHPQLYRAEGQPCKTKYQLDKRLSLVMPSKQH